MFEVGGGGGGVLRAFQSSVDSYIETSLFWRIKSLSFEGHIEKKMKYKNFG